MDYSLKMNQNISGLLIVTGLSGAGLSTALKDLEDMGYEVFDNFPLALLPALLANTGARHPIAVGIDARGRGFSAESVLEMVQRYNAKLVFMTADDAVLQKRFTETRRRHPMAKDRPVAAGIKMEQELLYPLRAAADLVIDTTDLSVHDLKRAFEGHFGKDGVRNLAVTLMSFGFRFGIPREADSIMDVRFMKNPHWVPALKPLTGMDGPVGEYIETDAHFEHFITHYKGLIGPLLPLYAREGKSYLTLAIGCTGGQHRSVYIVETLKKWLEQQPVSLTVLHRDIKR